MRAEDYDNTVLMLVYTRAAKNITAVEMAKICKVSRQAIHDFETHKTVSYKLLLKYIAHLLSKEEAADLIEKWGK